MPIAQPMNRSLFKKGRFFSYCQKMKLTRAAEAVGTRYWMPGDDYVKLIAAALEGRIDDGDIVTVSEKALSTSKGHMIDESKVQPGLLAMIMAKLWMRIVWGFFLGQLCRLKQENIRRCRTYPVKEGRAHKQVALWQAGFLSALLWGSEGGIDASNLPYSYVSLPLDNPQQAAEEIRSGLAQKLGKKVVVMIVDTDKTYSYGGFHFTHRRNPLKGINSSFGFLAYVAGRTLRLKRRSTPLAVAGVDADVGFALELAEAAHRRRGSGAGLTVWDMADRFGVGVTNVTWQMLQGLRHRPIVVLKRERLLKAYSKRKRQ
jgi:F420-0:gamma-glutamyl ligase-like protein